MSIYLFTGTTSCEIEQTSFDKDHTTGHTSTNRRRHAIRPSIGPIAFLPKGRKAKIRQKNTDKNETTSAPLLQTKFFVQPPVQNETGQQDKVPAISNCKNTLKDVIVTQSGGNSPVQSKLRSFTMMGGRNLSQDSIRTIIKIAWKSTRCVDSIS